MCSISKEPHLVYRIRVVHEKSVVELKTVCICIFHLWELQHTTYRYSFKTVTPESSTRDVKKTKLSNEEFLCHENN